MVYETSYESGRKPFVPDLSRGHWAHPGDYIFACIGLAFKMDVFFVGWFFLIRIGVATFIPYIICLGLYVVPIMVIQSFMGQFSSSGFISVFRISPLFKGMGYISLFLNLSILMYYSLFAAVPLLYLFHAFRPTLPWSCAGLSQWTHNITEEEKVNICNVTHPTNLTDDSDLEFNGTDPDPFLNYHVPSVLFFKSHFNDMPLFEPSEGELAISWELVMGTLFTWGVIAFVMHKCFNTEKFGKVLRYATWTTLALMLICLTRFIFLPGATKGLKEYLQPSWRDIEVGIPSIPVFAMSAFGAGWGTIVSLASFNRFKTNIMRYSWIITLGQMVVLTMFGLISCLLDNYFSEITSDNYFSYVEYHWILFLSSASAMADMELANMWTIFFYTMLTLAALIVMLTQLYSVLISIYDEFEFLRNRKQEVTFGLIGILALFSLYFCTNHGVIYFAALSVDSLFTQTALNLLLLLVMLWIYGRERFQRDIEFMLSQRFSTLKVNLLRFVSPICLLITLFVATFCAIYEHFFASIVVLIFAIFLIVIPWLFVPGYAIFILLQTTGRFGIRFRRSCRPTDWYPLESEDRQRYEEAMGNMDTTHQLHEVDDDVL